MTSSDQPEGCDRIKNGAMEWLQVPGGHWVLSACRYEYARGESPRDPIATFDMHVSEFDPEPAFNAATFDWKQVEMQPGTRVTVADVNRRPVKSFRAGEREGIPQEILDQLAEEVKKRTLTTPK